MPNNNKDMNVIRIAKNNLKLIQKEAKTKEFKTIPKDMQGTFFRLALSNASLIDKRSVRYAKLSKKAGSGEIVLLCSKAMARAEEIIDNSI